MPYLIDGHNLIPKLGLRLDSVDDEMELIAILQEFCRLERKQVEVYFDGAPQAQTRKLGAVTATFIPLTSTADNAIRNRLKKMGKSAKNWTVVSSDREVQADARAAQAEVISSEKFAKMIRKATDSPQASKVERVVSEQELEEWMKMFGGRKKREEED